MADQEVIKQPEEITQEEKDVLFWSEIETKATEFTAKSGRKVVSFSLPDGDGGHVVGYMYEPDNEVYDDLCWHKLTSGKDSIKEAKKHLEGLVWWHESDPNMRSRENLTGAALFLLSLIKISLPEFKKK